MPETLTIPPFAPAEYEIPETIPNPQLTASFSSELMETYVQGSLSRDLTGLRSVRADDGGYQLFGLYTGDGDPTLCNLSLDSSKDGGWVADFVAPTFRVEAYEPVYGPDGLYVFASSKSDHTLRRIVDRRWGTSWQEVGVFEATVKQMWTARRGDALALFVATETAVFRSLDPYSDSPSWTPVIRDLKKIRSVAPACVAGVPGTYVLFDDRNDKLYLGFYPDSGNPTLSGCPDFVPTGLTVSNVEDPQNTLVLTWNSVYVYQVLMNNGIQFDAIAQLPEPVHFLECSALSLPDYRGQRVYLTDTSGNLYQWLQIPNSEGEPEWSQPVPLSNLAQVANSLTVLPSYGDRVDLFFTASDENGLALGIVNFWQDATSDEWKSLPIGIANDAQEPVSVPCYRSQITVIDTDRVPRAGETLTIAASDDLQVEINGVHYFVGPNRAINCPTNAAGWVTISTIAENLGASCYVIGAGFFPSEISVRPDRYLQDILYTSPEPSGLSDLQGLLSSSDSPIPEAYKSGDNLDSLSEGIYQTMSLARQEPLDTTSLRGQLSSLGKVLPGGRARAGHIHLPSVQDQHWSLSFAPGRVRFQRYASRDALLLAESLDESGDTPWGWGTLWRAIRKDAQHLEHIAVTTLRTVGEEIGSAVVSAIQVVITFAGEVFNYTVTRIQEAFDVVQGIFEAIETTFLQVYRWLGKLFAWDDILLMQKYISLRIDQGLEGIRNSVVTLQNKFDAGLDTLQEHLQQMTQFTTDIPQSSQPISSIADQYASTADSGTPSQNWMLNQVINNPQAGLSGDVEPLARRIEHLNLQANALCEGLELDSSFQGLTQYFLRFWHDNPRIQDWTLDLLITTVADMMVQFDVIPKVKALTDAFFQALEELIATIQEFLDASVEVPLISSIYRKVCNGEELSLLGLGSLMIGLPTAILAKLAGIPLPALPSSPRSLNFEDASDAVLNLEESYIFGLCYGVTVGISTTIGSFATAVTLGAGWVKSTTDNFEKYFKNWRREQRVPIWGFLGNVFDMAGMVFACPCWTGVKWSSGNSTTMDFGAWLSLAISTVINSVISLVAAGQSIAVLREWIRDDSVLAKRIGTVLQFFNAISSFFFNTVAAIFYTIEMGFQMAEVDLPEGDKNAWPYVASALLWVQNTLNCAQPMIGIVVPFIDKATPTARVTAGSLYLATYAGLGAIVVGLCEARTTVLWNMSYAAGESKPFLFVR